MLLLNVFPKWTTAGAAQDRERLTQAFIEYHTTADLSEAAELMRQRVDVGKKYGLSIDALARMDIGLAQALLINTVPITTWMLLHIFSNPALLTELRIEVEQLFVRDVTESGTREGLVDFTKIKEECPLLVSTWQETLRMTSHLPSGRTVLEDTMLKDRYLLKKNATVFIFAGVLHADPKLWGPDVDKFNPRRFLKEGNQPMVHPIAFRPFGGGALLCPGRVFAFTEVLTFVATVILGFEIQSDNEVWPSLERDIYHPSLGVYKPKNAATANVVISRRVEYEDVTWDYPLQPVA
jgi:cytochrome P450